MKRILLLFSIFVLTVALRPSGSAIDLNNDGMSDVWQSLYGVTAFNSDLDWDGDGGSNYMESLFRTDPAAIGGDDFSGIAEITYIDNEDPTPDDVCVSWPTEYGVKYLLDGSPGLQNWATGMEIEGNGSVMPQVLVGAGSSIGFYRVYALPPDDADSDSFDTWEENHLGFTENNPGEDVDGDGIDDDWENYFFNNNLGVANDLGSDFDGDGLADEDEFTMGLDPTDIDLDNDGVADGFEDDLAIGTDPKVPDDPYVPPGPTGLIVFTPLLEPLP